MKRYSFHPVMLLRSPAYPFNYIKATTLQEHLDDEYFRNALFIASPEFYNELQKANFLLTMVKPKAFRSLNNYVNRLHYRSTPFGMFSGFGPVRWQEEGEPFRTVILNNRQLHILPEMDEKAYQTTVLENEMLLYTNPSIYKVGNNIRFLKSEYDYQHRKFRFQISAMPWHQLIHSILAYCQSPVHLKILKDDMAVKSGLREDEVQQLVQHLIGENLLLHKIKDSTLHCSAVRQSIVSESGLKNPRLKDKTRNTYANLSYKLADGNISNQQQEKIKNGLAALQGICQNLTPDGLRKFAAAFAHKFDGRAIPLMVALDPELGVGYRELEQTYIHSGLLADILFPEKVQTYKVVQWSRAHALLMNKIHESSQLNAKGILLDDDDLNRLSGSLKPLPPGLSVLFRPLGEDVFIESAGGATATALFGRFSIFDQKLGDTLRSIANNEVTYNPSVVFAEINCLQEIHAANVEQRIKVYPYEIPLMTFPTYCSEDIIPLSDLWISVKNGRIIMWSEKLKKEVIPRLSSAFNHSRSHMNIYRFLCDLQYQGLQTNFSLDLSHYFPNLSFYPRVAYKGAILSLACWEYAKPKQQVDGQFKEYKNVAILRQDLKSKGVPRYFASYQGDQQIVYDMESEEDMTTLENILYNKESIAIKEFPFPLHDSAFTDRCGGKYLEQYLTALLHQQEVYRSDISEQLSAGQLFGISRDADDWLYIKVYCHAGNSALILQDVMALVDGELMNGYTERYFYVIYLDPDYHLRLRLKCKKRENKASVFSLLEQALLPLRSQGVVSAINLDYYQREFERYGSANMEVVEDIFSQDTSWIMKSIAKKGLNEIGFIEASASVALLLETFQLSLDGKIAQCSLVFDSLFAEFRGDKALRLSLDKKHRSNRAEWKRQYGTTENSLRDSEHYSCIFLLIEKLVANCAHDEKGFELKEKLCSDIIHMHLNRIFLQSPREQEMIVYFLLLQYYKSLKYYN